MQNLFKKFQSVFFVIFLIVPLVVINLPTAEAAECKYGIAFNETSGSDSVTNATANQTLYFFAKVTESGDLNNCSKQVRVTLLTQTTSGDGAMVAQLKDVNNGTATASFAISLDQYKGYFLNPNTAKIKARVYIPASAFTDDTQVTESSYWTVNITGGSSATAKETVSLNPSKAVFNAGDSVTIYASVNSALYSEMQSRGVQNVYFNVFINTNDSSEPTTLPIGNFSGQASAKYGVMDITDENGFKNGPNTITVELWSAGTSVRLSSASTNLQAQGLKGSGSVNGSKDNGVVCNGSVECKSNFCSEDTGKCQSCSGDDSCNTAGDSGFVCTSGVCVKPSTNANPSNPSAPAVTHDCSGQNPDPNYCIYNPLPVSDLLSTLLLIMRGFLGIVGLWSVAFIVIGGFKLVTSQGNEEAVTSARKTITWAVVGFAIAVLAFSIMAIVQNVLMTDIKDVSAKTSMIKNLEL